MSNQTHPVTQFVNEFFAPDRVLLSPELFYQLDQDIALTFDQAMKIPVFNQKMTQYGETAFIDAINRSETVQLYNNKIQLKLKSKPLKICICKTGITSVDIQDLLKSLEIVKLDRFSVMATLTFDEEKTTSASLQACLESAGFQKISFQNEPLRDAFRRITMAGGITPAQVKEIHDNYHKALNDKLVASKPKGVYDMKTEEFKKESGYGKDIEVQATKLREFIKDVYDGKKEWKTVEMASSPVVSKNAAKRLWCNEKQRNGKKLEKEVEQTE
ncbi:hypothetical protein SS50377_27845 [Spironucleus salmonicida]|uniref:Uncharacterized protein n=1 Tax=Spironucleus salmonicida TaxID=348837 RepID=V6LW96_9EUKA|nr:hypothetical protein SS50377_27845 [Spironucleus salmonicida]|eukprot:EST48840.1 Hypothetical protein SS50377_10936 [Spironucleus salmonicida]